MAVGRARVPRGGQDRGRGGGLGRRGAGNTVAPCGNATPRAMKPEAGGLSSARPTPQDSFSRPHANYSRGQRGSVPCPPGHCPRRKQRGARRHCAATQKRGTPARRRAPLDGSARSLAARVPRRERAPLAQAPNAMQGRTSAGGQFSRTEKQAEGSGGGPVRGSTSTRPPACPVIAPDMDIGHSSQDDSGDEEDAESGNAALAARKTPGDPERRRQPEEERARNRGKRQSGTAP